MTRAETTEILKLLKDLHSGQNELGSDFKSLRTDFQRLEIKVDRIENKVGDDIKRLENQGQSHHADIVKMKEEIIGAFEITVRL